jgi:hypothetical protein
MERIRFGRCSAPLIRACRLTGISTSTAFVMNGAAAKAEKCARDFKDELAGEYDKAKAEWDSIDRKLMKWAIPAIAGHLAPSERLRPDTSMLR